MARNERAPDSGIGERRSREGDGGREKEGKEERERERTRGRVRGWPVARVPARVRE